MSFKKSERDRWVLGLIFVMVAAGPIAAAKADALAEPSFPDESRPGYARVDDQLSGLIDRLLAGHSELREMESRADVWVGGDVRAGAWPDTSINYRWFAQTPETRVGAQRQALEVMQPLPTAKRDRQAARVDRHRSASASWQTDLHERRLVAQLKRAYFEAAYVQEALVVNLEEIALMRRYEQIALTKYANGEGNQQPVIKVQADINRLFERRVALEQDRRRLEAKLAYLSASPKPSMWVEAIDLPDMDTAPTLGEINRTDSPEEHPESQAIREGLMAERANLDRIRMTRRPRWQVGLSWIEVADRDDPAGLSSPPPDNGQDVFSLMFGVKLPADGRRRKADLSETWARQRVREAQLESAEGKREWAIRDAWLRFDSLGDRIELHEEAIIPQSERALSAAEAAYTTGRMGFLDLLDAQRVTFASRLASHRLRVDRWIAATDLEEALGRPFPTKEEAR